MSECLHGLELDNCGVCNPKLSPQATGRVSSVRDARIRDSAERFGRVSGQIYEWSSDLVRIGESGKVTSGWVQCYVTFVDDNGNPDPGRKRRQPQDWWVSDFLKLRSEPRQPIESEHDVN